MKVPLFSSFKIISILFIFNSLTSSYSFPPRSFVWAGPKENSLEKWIENYEPNQVVPGEYVDEGSNERRSEEGLKRPGVKRWRDLKVWGKRSDLANLLYNDGSLFQKYFN